MNIDNNINRTIRATLLAFLVVSITLGNLQMSMAQTSIVGNKTLSPTDIRCGGETQVILTLSATGDNNFIAHNITIVDTVNDHFSVSNVSVGTNEDVDYTITQVGNIITLNIHAIISGTVETITYYATHNNRKSGGVEQVNDQVTYSDDEGNTVNFPSPTVNVRGCSAKISLTPATDTNVLGTPGQTHTVTAKVTDDFNDPLDHFLVDFKVIAGPNIGKNGSNTTDDNGTGEAAFTYMAEQGIAGLGTDTINAVTPPQNRVSVELVAEAKKTWIETVPPKCNCLETVNPAGKNIPPAGSTTLPGSKGGQNEDGFYKLTAKDNFDPNPKIYVVDTGSGQQFGPFASGTNIKYTQAKGVKPNQKNIGGPNSVVAVHITGTGDAAVFATDASGNKSPLIGCLVPPPPK